MPKQDGFPFQIWRPIVRTYHYVRAHLTLDDLKKRTAGIASQSPQLVKETFAFCEGFISPVQMKEEIEQLATDVRELRPSRVLEIGTAKGGTLYLWTCLATSNATIVSVDLPAGKYGGGYSPQRAAIYKRFALPQQTVHLLRADSHATETRDRVIDLFAGEPVDFLFLDGDHSYQGVKQDWLYFSPLVRPGGLIAFHDIAMSYEETHVKKLWDEIRPFHEHWEYAFHMESIFGIGVIRKALNA